MRREPASHDVLSSLSRATCRCFWAVFQRLGTLSGDLLVLHGEARYCWTHGIQARMEDVFGGVRRQRGTRVSVTLRRMVGAARETGSEEHGAPRTLESVRL